MNYLTTEELGVCWEVRRMCACDQLRRATRRVTQLYDNGLAASGLKVTQLPIFVGLGSEGDLPLSGALGRGPAAGRGAVRPGAPSR